MNKKKRILIVTPNLPYPPNRGGFVRIYNLLKFLSAKYDFYLLSFVEQEEQVFHCLQLKKYYKEVYPVLHQYSPIPSFETFFLPKEVEHFCSQVMVETLKEIVEKQSIDLVQIEFILMANYVNFISGVPVIFTEHDASHFSFERSIHYRELNETERFADWQKLVKFETEICRKFNKLIVLTEEDKEQLKSALPYEADISVVPTGVDTKFFRRRSVGASLRGVRLRRTTKQTDSKGHSERSEESHGDCHGLRPRNDTLCRIATPQRFGTRNDSSGVSYNLVYVGHYLHYPNQDAVFYFYEKIFPLIVQKKPEVKLYLVGSNPTPKILELQKDSRVIVTGEVPDIRPYLQKGDVFIAPLRVGGGIKGKILEAMAMGVPVVANKLGASGIEAKPREEIIIAEKPEEFAKKTSELLKNRELREKIAKNARKLVERKYDWRVIVPKLSRIYEETITGSNKKIQ